MKTPDLPSPWLTARCLAQRWQITTKTLRIWRKSGKLHAYHFGRGVRFALAEIEQIERESRA
ncbi:helix-turn-helix domain-containing protein [Prosthecobacter vanneervenii]|uniref:helix-turn-helix domain-containing protein n=1 Tax=Prosthecobacter vanneervenii TaxID=48466 RepID=UPI0038B6162D